MKTSEVLRKAVDIINERGWHQGDYVSETGSVCVLGACGIATGYEIERYGSFAGLPITYFVKNTKPVRTDDLCDELDVAKEYIERHLATFTDEWVVPTFNDDPSTTKEDVILALKHAAYDAELAGD